MVRAFTNSPQTLSESKFAKIQSSHFGGGGGGRTHGNQFPTFVPETKFAKIQSSHFRRGGGGVMGSNFQLLLLRPNLLKSKVPISRGGGGGGGTNFQLLLLSLNLLESKVPIFGVGGGRFMETNFQLLFLRPNLLKSKVPIFRGGGGGHGNQFPTFVAETKFAEIQSSHFWGGGGKVLETNFPNF